MDIRFHYIRDKFADKTLLPKYVKSDEQCADFLTKSLTKERFHALIGKVGMCESKKALE